MNKILILATVVILTIVGCGTTVWVPMTPEGQACIRHCKLTSPNRFIYKNCFSMCPGAYER